MQPSRTSQSYAVAVDVVTSNLRTHIGSPGQTLHAFEGPLQQAQPVGLARSMTLLKFLWHLERLILHASVGGPFSPFPKSLLGTKSIHPTITFFTANKSVCQTWLSKIRHKVQSLASSARLHSYSAFYSEAALSACTGARVNFDSASPDGHVGEAESRAAKFVEALVALDDTDQISGVRAWLLDKVRKDPRNAMSAENVSKRLGWIDAAGSFARGQYERTARELVKMLNMSEFLWGKVRRPNPNNRPRGRPVTNAPTLPHPY